MKEGYQNTYGTWQVTTEGDVEGRTIKHLGTHTGHIDEIALHLADRCYYSLSFKRVDPIEEYVPSKSSVSVQFSVDSDTWNTIKSPEGFQKIKDLFKNRPVKIEESNYHASFTILVQNPKEVEDNIARQKALGKLSEEDKRVLGLT